MEFTAGQIATIVNGRVEGSAETKVNKLSKIEEGETGSLTFLSNPLYNHFIYTTKASVTIVKNDFVPAQNVASTLIYVESPEHAFAALLELYNKIKNDKKGVSTKSTISETAKVGSDLYLGDFSFIGDNAIVGNHVKIFPQSYVGDNCSIGDNTIIYPGVKIYSDCVVGKNCIIHAGVVIGSDGFRFEVQNGAVIKIAQIGNVIIEDNVEIGANCTIDRATLGSTILRNGVKLDNLVHLAHNVEIGENTCIAANGVIAGSTKIGKNCMFSGQVGIVGHLNIADGTIIAAQSGISKSITKEKSAVMGSPSMEITAYRKAYVHFRNLSKIVARLDQLENDIKKKSEET